MLERNLSPQDLKKMTQDELRQLSDEIRQQLIKTVSQNGGHLASNLGVVELTIALLRVFDPPADRILFDVGHQSYVYKLLTGRADRFHTLREFGGLSGFPKREESEYDAFDTGHASTAISAALGYARARDLLGESRHVIAVVGDGALTGGMCYEALNDAGNSHIRMMVILNDNEMSIAPNVGAISSYLTRLRVSSGWQRAKRKVRHLGDIPLVGHGLYRVLHASKKVLKSLLVKDTDMGFFETLGFEYFGPIDGHDLPSLEHTLRIARDYPGSCVIHVLTQKGHGYEQAEERPEAFHGTPPFYIETGNRISPPTSPSNGHVMADQLSSMADKDPRIIAITAAMPLGTGLDHFAEKHPDRLIDVGIAEEHAATMAAGLAAGGMRPYVAVYASFFQRCYDQMLQDVCMQRLPVVFLLDRSGIGGEDGPTHHGLFDLSLTLPVPGLTVLAPCDSVELCQMLDWTITADSPCVIRYPKSGPVFDRKDFQDADSFVPGIWRCVRSGQDLALLATGSMLIHALRTAELLASHGKQCAVWNCSSIKPADQNALVGIANAMPFFTLEEHMRIGGFGEYVTSLCAERRCPIPLHCFAIEGELPAHGEHTLLIREAGLNSQCMAERILKMIKECIR